MVGSQIDRELLLRLYRDECLTAAEIAARTNCAPNTILRRLRRFGIPPRPRGPIRRGQGLGGSVRWSSDVAYAVGLIATDGNLSRDGRHLTLVSKDCHLLETFRTCLDIRRATIRPHRSGFGRVGLLRLQWGDRHFYDWLLGIGLTPAKSLTLGALTVPDAVFPDFVRGCLDGDGSVVVYIDRQHIPRCSRYVYERLYVSLVSASRAFLDWIQSSIHRLVALKGSIAAKRVEGRSAAWTLRYAKRESIELLRWIYYSPAVPCLLRKRATAESFLHPLGVALARSVGRPRVGWVYNQVPPRPP
jgi:hypothetical protein